MKKLTFLLLAMVFFICIFVLASTAAIADEAVRNRDDPVFVITADTQPEVVKITITRVSIPSQQCPVWAAPEITILYFIQF